MTQTEHIRNHSNAIVALLKAKDANGKRMYDYKHILDALGLPNTGTTRRVVSDIATNNPELRRKQYHVRSASEQVAQVDRSRKEHFQETLFPTTANPKKERFLDLCGEMAKLFFGE